MQYIRFYKDRLPFKPKSNVVIYFDVVSINRKHRPSLVIDEDEVYDVIKEMFQRGGLELCFLPRIADRMELDKIYRYFNPQAGEKDYLPYYNLYHDQDLLDDMVEGYDERLLEPGLIQYMGEGFDKENTYTFSYTPFPSDFELNPYDMIGRYVEQHGAHDAFFEREEREGFFGRLFYRNRESSAPARICEEACVQTSRSVSADEDDVEMVMSEVQMLVERLRRSGVGEIALQRLFQPTQELSRIHVRYGRIFLPDYHNLEIKMPPLSKAIYMLYLRHPEGIKFSYLPDYREELLRMYELISGRESREEIRRSIDDVTDPTRNSINEKCSRIKQAFLREFDDSIAQNYYITGERGEAKKILLPQEKIIWEMPN
ncbi:MAG: hypothetical protein J5616_02550 [Bacteroidaceae bacterium]|nr:hypothetical protein [Bacteroidaceae bacterium]